jgi:subtilisin family serine protease
MESKSCTRRRRTAGSDNLTPIVAAIESLEQRLLMRHGVWGLVNHLVGQDSALSAYPTVNGRGESIAVIDTGIDYNNPVLGGGTGKGFKVRTGWNFISNNGNYLDTDGHGTAVAGVIAADAFKYRGKIYQGVAPQAQLIALKVDDGVHNPPASRIRAALQWVLNNQTKYNIVSVNISEGDNNRYFSKTSTNQYSDLLAQCAARGIFVAAAAGNDGWSNGVEYPAADPNVAAVSSVDYLDSVSDFSDTGPSLDLLAPGEDVVSPTLSGGREVFSYVAGTSFSAPWAAGAAALIKQLNPRFSTTQILQTMEATGSADTDPTNGMSFSRLDLFAALNSTDKAVRRARAAGQ